MVVRIVAAVITIVKPTIIRARSNLELGFRTQPDQICGPDRVTTTEAALLKVLPLAWPGPRQGKIGSWTCCFGAAKAACQSTQSRSSKAVPGKRRTDRQKEAQCVLHLTFVFRCWHW